MMWNLLRDFSFADCYKIRVVFACDFFSRANANAKI